MTPWSPGVATRTGIYGSRATLKNPTQRRLSIPSDGSSLDHPVRYRVGVQVDSNSPSTEKSPPSSRRPLTRR